MNPVDRPIHERLFEGAKRLGQFWRADERCATQGWAVRKAADSGEGGFAPEICACEPKTRFCRAKVQWLMLAAVEPREIVEGEYGLPLTMKGAEWDATGMTLSWDFLGLGNVRVGPKGGLAMKDLMKLRRTPEAGFTTLKLMVRFNGSKLEFEPAAAKPAEAATVKAAEGAA